MTTQNHDYRSDTDKSAKAVRTTATLVGAAFILGGVLGITTDYDSLKFAGHMSNAKLLGLFEVSILHNIVHLLYGVAGLAMARTARSAVTYLIGGGVIYLILWIYGLLVGQESKANFVPLNTADNWLHLFLGLGMIALGVLGHRALRNDRVRT